MKIHAWLLVLGVPAGLAHATSSKSTCCQDVATVTKTLGSDGLIGIRPSTESEVSRLHIAAQPDVDPASTNRPGTRKLSSSVSSGTTSSTNLASPATKTLTLPAPTASSSADVPLKACWSSKDCMDFLDDFTRSYDLIGGNLTDLVNRRPQGMYYASVAYSSFLCKSKHYENVLVNGTLGPATPMLPCFLCFQQTGIDFTATKHLEGQTLIAEIDAFCHSKQPYLLDLFDRLLWFMRSLSAPEKFDNTPLPVTAVVASLTGKPTRSSGSNEHTSSSTAWWQTPLSPGGPIPTEYLSQLPSNWPYTAYNIMHSAGKTTSWPFVNPIATSQTVAWLYHSILYNPRPLYTPKEHRTSSMYNPLLANWTHNSIYDTALQTPPPSSLSATPATPRSSPFSPTITQSAVMPLEPDSDVEILASMRSKSDADKSSTTNAPAMASDGPQATSVGIDNLLSIVESMKSKLDAKLVRG